jgi:phage FluMu protein Com
MNATQADQSYAGAKTIVVCEHCRQKLRIPQSRTWIRVTCPRCRREFNYRFTGSDSPMTRGSSQDSASGAILAVLGLVFLVGGIVLFVGNMSGAFPTFPFAGFITSSIGLTMLAAALQK